MDWIDLAQDRDRWRAVVNAWWTFGLHNMQGISWVAEDLLGSQEGLCSMELVELAAQYFWCDDFLLLVSKQTEFTF
jgi:hypothetical protein